MIDNHSLADLEKDAGLKANKSNSNEKQCLLPKAVENKRVPIHNDLMVGDLSRFHTAPNASQWSRESVVMVVIGGVILLFGIGIIVAIVRQRK